MPPAVTEQCLLSTAPIAARREAAGLQQDRRAESRPPPPLLSLSPTHTGVRAPVTCFPADAQQSANYSLCLFLCHVVWFILPGKLLQGSLEKGRGEKRRLSLTHFGHQGTGHHVSTFFTRTIRICRQAGAQANPGRQRHPSQCMPGVSSDATRQQQPWNTVLGI